MSASAGHIRCHGCDFEGVIQHRPVTLRYVLPDGTSVEGHREFAWCMRCNGVRDVEQKLDARALHVEIQRLAASRPKGFFGAIDRALGGGSKDEDIELQRLSSLLKIAKLRKSAPRCLICGDHNAIPLLFDEDGNCVSLRHACGGSLYRLPPNPNAPRFAYRPETIALDIEGNRLG